MTKEQNAMTGLEIVAYAGDARSCYLSALKEIKKGDIQKAKYLIEEGNECINDAHKVQTELLQQEAAGNYSDVTLIMVHGQDHLMTTILLKELMDTMIFLAEKK